jgi:hypothetical protein
MEKNMDKDPDFAESYKFVEYEEKKYIKNLSQEKASVVTPNIFLISLPITQTSQGSQASSSIPNKPAEQNEKVMENVDI